MARLLVNAENLHKAFGGKTLLDGATFQVEAGERVALVGPNGSGKSTLLNMLAGAERPDAGEVRIPTHLKVSFFHQHPEVAKDATVKDALVPGGGAPPALLAEAAELEARMADPALYESGESDDVLARYAEVQSEIARAKGSVRADAVESPLFEELGFTDADLSRKVASLSGGERTRLFLARTLAEADPAGLLVLDEPTNHLDVETIEWLEERMQAWTGTVLVVAHDRAFLDNVATRVVAIENAKLVSYAGNYTEFERRREEDAQRLEQRRANERKELERQKAVIEQFKHQKRFNGQMASRLTALAKYRAAIDKTPDPLVERVQMAVGFPESFKSSNDVMRVRDLAKKYGDTLLFHGLDLDVRKGDRIGLVGANGAGKTTLLRILVGKERKDLGTIDVVPGVKGAYFAQGNETLIPHRTLREEVLDARPGLEDEDVRALLGRFGFRAASDLQRKVSSLSGGERSRLALLKVVIQPSNLLILDEPTNHLDLESRAALVRALNAYKGTLLIVSHDRWFLDSVITSVAVLARHSIKVFPGDLTTARTSAMMEEFQVEKPTPYVVRKAFKDFDTGAKHTVGSVLHLMPADISGKRLYRTALAMGWMVEE